eukprot:Opistho-1_new@969
MCSRAGRGVLWGRKGAESGCGGWGGMCVCVLQRTVRSGHLSGCSAGECGEVPFDPLEDVRQGDRVGVRVHHNLAVQIRRGRPRERLVVRVRTQRHRLRERPRAPADRKHKPAVPCVRTVAQIESLHGVWRWRHRRECPADDHPGWLHVSPKNDAEHLKPSERTRLPSARSRRNGVPNEMRTDGPLDGRARLWRRTDKRVRKHGIVHVRPVTYALGAREAVDGERGKHVTRIPLELREPRDVRCRRKKLRRHFGRSPVHGECERISLLTREKAVRIRQSSEHLHDAVHERRAQETCAPARADTQVPRPG